MEQNIQAGRDGHFSGTSSGVVEIHDTQRRLQGARGDTCLVRLGGNVEDGSAGGFGSGALYVSSMSCVASDGYIEGPEGPPCMAITGLPL